jgi:hypothetical protein
MVYQTLSYGIMNSSFGRNEGVQNTMTKIDPGVKETRGRNIIGKSIPGSIYHGVQNTI